MASDGGMHQDASVQQTMPQSHVGGEQAGINSDTSDSEACIERDQYDSKCITLPRLLGSNACADGTCARLSCMSTPVANPETC